VAGILTEDSESGAFECISQLGVAGPGLGDPAPHDVATHVLERVVEARPGAQPLPVGRDLRPQKQSQPTSTSRSRITTQFTSASVKPAPAMVHESESGTNFSPCLTNWLLHGEGLWPAKFEHPIEACCRRSALQLSAIRDDEPGAGHR
jgi:hypothetical protein